MSKSALYIGKVSHRRLRPKVHALAYRIFQIFLDLDEAQVTSQSLRLFGFNRPALLSFWEKDHGDGSGRSLKTQIAAKVAAAGLAADGPIRVLTMPRVLGYVFNPITLYFVHDRQAALSAVVHEVNNTIGGRIFYVLPAAGDGIITQRTDKQMYVSPFMDMDYVYDFQLAEPAETFALAIHMKRSNELWLTASFAGEHRDFSDRELFLAWLSHPLLTIKVIAAIHWEALRIWLRGISYRSPPVEAPTDAVELAQRGA